MVTMAGTVALGRASWGADLAPGASSQALLRPLPAPPLLRQRMVDAMELRGFAARTQQAYVGAVDLMARHYGVWPGSLSDEQIQAYLLHLLRQRGLSRSTVNQAACAARFMVCEVLGEVDRRPHLAVRQPCRCGLRRSGGNTANCRPGNIAVRRTDRGHCVLPAGRIGHPQNSGFRRLWFGVGRPVGSAITVKAAKRRELRRRGETRECASAPAENTAKTESAQILLQMNGPLVPYPKRTRRWAGGIVPTRSELRKRNPTCPSAQRATRQRVA